MSEIMADDTEPTTEWEHSHKLTSGDELIDTVEDTPLTVADVHDDGGVTVEVWAGDGHGDGPSHTETYSEKGVRDALADGLFATTDGESHELATF